ncbi:hypothetical protein [Gemmobacter caeruleus]|uniref:hypothetical protein n=1 Tax=Gemmobacter caeruleus TaxID=2595004 RepID=UPI0011EE0217|nr:hypothetical protein [Gemmobacter caeruleus]
MRQSPEQAFRPTPRVARLRFALGMTGALCLLVGLILSSMPGASEARVCRMQIGGPLAGTCAAR